MLTAISRTVPNVPRLDKLFGLWVRYFSPLLIWAVLMTFIFLKIFHLNFWRNDNSGLMYSYLNKMLWSKGFIYLDKIVALCDSLNLSPFSSNYFKFTLSASDLSFDIQWPLLTWSLLLPGIMSIHAQIVPLAVVSKV